MLPSAAVKLYLNGLLALFLFMPQMRVALIKGLSNVALEGEELMVRNPQARDLATYTPSPTKITASRGGFQVGPDYYPYPYIKIHSLNNNLRFQKTLYSGTLEIRKMKNGTLTVINELPIETYLIGLLHGEMHHAWPIEALKAQAVAARSYALNRQKKRKGQLFDLESDVRDQVYVGSQGNALDAIMQKAIAETAGEVLWYLGLYPTYYHSCCGGQTEEAKQVWGKNEKTDSVVDNFCKNSPNLKWNLTLKGAALLAIFNKHGLTGNRLTRIEAEKSDENPRNQMVILTTDTATLYLKAVDFRRIVGFDKIKSTWFQITQNNQGFHLTGFGYGHGVGLCQWGAKEMALQGKTYREILKHYYPQSDIQKIY